MIMNLYSSIILFNLMTRRILKLGGVGLVPSRKPAHAPGRSHSKLAEDGEHTTAYGLNLPGASLLRELRLCRGSWR